MKYAGFSEGQRKYLQKSLGAWLNVAEGGKRAGKNVINVIAFAMAVEESPERLHMVAGVTKACAMVNIVDCNGFGLRHFFGGRCRRGKFEGKAALFVDCRGGHEHCGSNAGLPPVADGEKIIIIEGGGKGNDAARIKGASFGAVYLSEANEMHPTFFFEALDRTLASRQRKVFLDLNAKQEGHWFYREFLDRMEGEGVNHGHFTIFDNLAIAPEDLQEALGSYDKASAWYKRDILGLRCGGADSIYVGFGQHLIKPRGELAAKPFVRMAVGVDVGGRDATVATLIGITADGELCLVDGYYHKQGDGEVMTHSRYVEELSAKIASWAEEFNTLAFSGAVFCEAAEKMFRTALSLELRARGMRLPVHPSYKAGGILERIRLFCLLINGGRLFVAEHLRAWADAFYAARWCERARASGEWVRVDDGSYSVDCLDSSEYAVIPFKGGLV